MGVVSERVSEDLMESEVRQQVEKILRSPGFSHSLRMQRFLRYISDETLAGRAALLKEFSIALKVYDKPTTFDPTQDSIIRVEANRLRRKLEEYYARYGRGDGVCVFLPRGHYAPKFCRLDLPHHDARASAVVNSEAYRLYLEGHHLWSQHDPECESRAIKCFSDALDKQPGYPPALAGISCCHVSLGWLEYKSPAQTWSAAELYARRALREDSALLEAHGVLCCRESIFMWRWQHAEDGFRQALASYGSSAVIQHWYGLFCLAPLGRLDEAELFLRQACELDRSSAPIQAYLGQILFFRRNYGNAIRHYRNAIQLNPKLFLAWWGLGIALAQTGDWDQAKHAFSVAHGLSGLPLAFSGIVYVDALCGRPADAEAGLTRLQNIASTQYVSPLNSL